MGCRNLFISMYLLVLTAIELFFMGETGWLLISSNNKPFISKQVEFGHQRAIAASRVGVLAKCEF